MSIRVLVVDDHPDVRMLLRIGIELRSGMEVVGEAADGLEGVRLAEATAPDIVILDREMPVAGGLEVLPRLREVCPGAVIALFTATADHEVRRAASSAGADAVRTKGGQSVDALVEDLGALLLGAPSDPDVVRLRVGPVDAGSAARWVDNTSRTLDALLRCPDAVPPGVSADLLQVFGEILGEWAAVAAAADTTFYWSAAAPVATIDALVRAWAELDRLDDATMDRLGCCWSPPEATPFFEALTFGVVVALQRHEELKGIVRDLPDDWSAGDPLEAEAAR